MQIIKRRSRGFICVNAHPEGCLRNVERWIAGVKGKISGGQNAPKNVLVIGASTGYGLASRIAAAWGYGAKTLGVFFERPPEGDKTAKAKLVGALIAERARDAGISAVVFDRGGYQYHGRVAALADTAREAGLTL